MRKHCYRLTASVVFFYALAPVGIYQAAAFAQQAGDQQMHLSLIQAMQMALVNNKDIELARQNVLASDWDLKGAVAQYDPRSTINSYYERTKMPVASFLSGGINGALNQSDLMAGYRLDGFASRGGGTYQVDLTSRRFTTDNIFAALNPQYPSELMFRYTQPLGRGRSFPNRTKEIAIAKKNSRLTDAQFRRIAADTVLNVKSAYWDLVFARHNLTIQGETLRDTRRQLEVIQRRVRTGTVAAIDAARPEARVAESEENVSRAMEQLTRTENALKNLIAESSDAPLWNVALIPTETLSSDVSVMPLQQALAAALDNRIELEETEIIWEINAIEERYFQDQTRPQIDLVGSY
ncbi:MAG TPA: TolC family protein, partial [Terriglobia bacterium]|nr:TolC family protein [Terriglobia bacterium]